MPTQPSRELETFPNPKPERDYQIRFETSEFTCVCPMTGQPDFATLRIRYVPHELCVELKSLKLYLWSFSQKGVFAEQMAADIKDRVVADVKPLSCSVTTVQKARGGISIETLAEYHGA